MSVKHRSEHAARPRRGLGAGPECVGAGCRGLLAQRQVELGPARAVEQREDAGGVGPRLLDRVYLPRRRVLVGWQGPERGVRPAGRVLRGRAGGHPPVGPVADLAPELKVRHTVVAGVDPPVDGRGRQAHGAAVVGRHLLGG